METLWRVEKLLLVKSEFSLKMSLQQEDELLVPLGADGYLQNLLKQKSLLDHVWAGFKFTCLFLSLVCRAKHNAKNCGGQK